MVDSINNTVDAYFRNREIPWQEGVILGDTVSVLPDTFVPFGEPALGVTPIYVTMNAWTRSRDSIPAKAFWMTHPDGRFFYGENWVSGETRYG